MYVLCDGSKNNTILLGGDICDGWHSRYWAEYKGQNNVEHEELSVQNMIQVHKKFPQVSTMMVNSILNFYLMLILLMYCN